MISELEMRLIFYCDIVSKSRVSTGVVQQVDGQLGVMPGSTVSWTEQRDARNLSGGQRMRVIKTRASLPLCHTHYRQIVFVLFLTLHFLLHVEEDL